MHLRTPRTRLRLVDPGVPPPGSVALSYGAGLSLGGPPPTLSVDFGTGHEQVARGDSVGGGAAPFTALPWTGWTEHPGAGTATVNVGNVTLTWPSGVVNNWGGPNAAFVTRPHGGHSAGIEVTARVASATNLQTSGSILVGVCGGVPGVAYWVEIKASTLNLYRQDGGWLAVGSAVVALPLDGTGWVRLRIAEGFAEAFYGIGDGTAEGVPSTWTLVATEAASALVAAGNGSPNVALVLNNGLAEALDTTAVLDGLRVRRLS